MRLPSTAGPCLRTAGLAVLLYLGFVGLALLGPAKGDSAWFIHLGSQRIPVALARRVLGRDVVVPHTDGHDGRFFWVQARDPLMLHPAADAANLDRPVYRAQRIAYPALAAPWRVFGEYGVVWALLLTNVGLIGIGSATATALAIDLGCASRAGLAFALNPAVIAGVILDTADVLAIAGIIGVVLLVKRGHLLAAGLVAAVAVLAKEPSILAIGAVSCLWPGLPSRQRIGLVTAAALPAAMWALYMRWRLAWASGQLQELTWPGYGYWDAYRRGWRPVGNWADAGVAAAVVLLAAAVIVLWLRRRSVVLLAALPFAVLVPLFSAQVLDLTDNSIRALGPAVTLLVLELYRPHPAPPVGAP